MLCCTYRTVHSPWRFPTFAQMCITEPCKSVGTSQGTGKVLYQTEGHLGTDQDRVQLGELHVTNNHTKRWPCPPTSTSTSTYIHANDRQAGWRAGWLLAGVAGSLLVDFNYIKPCCAFPLLLLHPDLTLPNIASQSPPLVTSLSTPSLPIEVRRDTLDRPYLSHPEQMRFPLCSRVSYIT